MISACAESHPSTFTLSPPSSAGYLAPLLSRPRAPPFLHPLPTWQRQPLRDSSSALLSSRRFLLRRRRRRDVLLPSFPLPWPPRFPFSSRDFPSADNSPVGPRSPSSGERRHRALSAPLCLSSHRDVLLPSFSHVGQFHPLSIRHSHCWRVSRLAEVKPSDDFLAGTWFRRALRFFSLAARRPVPRPRLRPALRPFFSCPLSSAAVVTDDRSKGTHDRRIVTAV